MSNPQIQIYGLLLFRTKFKHQVALIAQLAIILVCLQHQTTVGSA
jgi:hypothetical protein